MLNAAFIERLNATFREQLASLTRQSRHAASRLQALYAGMYLIGCTYNFCVLHNDAGGHQRRRHYLPLQPKGGAAQQALDLLFAYARDLMLNHRLVWLYLDRHLQPFHSQSHVYNQNQPLG